MGLDIRLPIGMMFTLLGALLGIYGFATRPGSNPEEGLPAVVSPLTRPQDMYACSLGMNVNLWWGLVLFVFGAVMLFFALRARFARK